MAVVAGLFDSEVDATKAFDRLMRENLPNVETRVIDGSARGKTGNPDVVIPIIPNTSGGPSQGGIGPAGAGASALPLYGEWLNQMDDVERHFYEDALKEGTTLAMAKVPDEDVSKVRLIFQTFGARVYDKK